MNDRGKHVPALDGLRGMAILMVSFAHFSGEAILKKYYPMVGPVTTKLAHAGLNGVDLFFVLSGFLITGILLDSKGRSRYLLNFYARRFLRIFPAYYTSLFLIFFIVPHFFPFDAAAREIAGRQRWLWGYLGNHPAAGGNWDASPLFQLGHFWSLAVELHFYFIWPLVVMFFAKRLKQICVIWFAISAVTLVASSMVNIDCHLWHWSSITRTGGLLLGSYCAILTREQGEPYDTSRKIFLTGLAIYSLLIFIPRSWFGLVLNNVLSTVSWIMYSALLMLLVSGTSDSRLNRLFANRILMKFGLYSYGIYICHGILRPVFERLLPREALIVATGSPFLGILSYLVLAIGLSYTIAWVSWHGYEKHFIKLKSYFR